MKKTLVTLVATTALTAAIGIPAWSAMRSLAGADGRPIAAVFDDGREALALVLVGDDDDDEHRRRSRYGHDDDHDDDDDDDDDERHGARNPPRAGTVAPPQNGLFGNGAPPPKVQVK